MVASAVRILGPPDGGNLPDTIARPAITVYWEGGTGPFDVDYIWDDDPTFANGNGNQQTQSNSGVTSQDTASPGSDLADLSDGTTWYLRATVVDTGDSGELSDDTSFTYEATNPKERAHLYLLGDIGVGFGPTDDPESGDNWDWNTDPADGYTEDFDRYLYLHADVGVGFSTDEPAGGWGTGGTGPADGDTTEDFDRYLYLLANLDTTQPCPFLTSASKPIVETGDTIVVRGQGLVSASSPTADAYGAELRLYESASFGASYTTLTIVDYTSGVTEDTIVATIPGGVASGFLAVVHTTGATCDGSNFLGLTVISQAGDRTAGWWAEVWNIRNNTVVVDHVKDAEGFTFEMIPNDIGGGTLTLPADHRDLLDIVNRSADPAVQRFVKVYLWGRYAYGFFPDDAVGVYGDDGKRSLVLSGAGPEQMLQWGKALWKDHPSNPARNRAWQYGSTANIAGWGDFDPDSSLPNGTFEGADSDGWVVVGGATVFTGSTVARTGSYSMQVTGDTDEGVETDPLSIQPDRDSFFDLYLYDPTNSGNEVTVQVIATDSEDAETVADSAAVNVSNIWQPVNLEWTPDDESSYRVQVIITESGVTSFPFYIDDGALFSDPNIPTLDEIRCSVDLTRDYVDDGLHALKVTCDADGDDTFNGFIARAAVAPNTDYRLAIRVTGDPGDQILVSMRVGSTVYTEAVTITGPLGTFETVTLEGTSDADDTVMRLAFSSRDSSAITFYLDTLNIYPGAPAAPAGEIGGAIHDAMIARGALDMVSRTFTDTTDSAGNPWTEDLTLDVPPDWSLYDFCQYLVGLGYDTLLAPENWTAGGDTGWELSIWNPGEGGNDWTGDPDGPTYLPGHGIANATPSAAPPAVTAVYGEGKDGVWAVQTADAPTIASLERREDFIYNRELTTATTLSRAVGRRLSLATTRGNKGVVQWAGPYADPLPFFDFFPMDTLRAHLPADTIYAGIPDDAYRVAAVSVAGTEEAIEGEVDLGLYSTHRQNFADLLVARAVERARSADNFTPGTGRVAGSQPDSGAIALTATSEPVPHTHTQDELEGVLSPEGPAGGDLTGAYPNPAVASLKGVDFDLVTAKGDLYVFDGTDLKRLPVGSDGQMLYADSGQALGIDWAAAPSGGGGGGLESSATLVGVALTSSLNTGDTTVTVNFDAGTEEGDLVVIIAYYRNSFQWAGPDEAGWELHDIWGIAVASQGGKSDDDNVGIWSKVIDTSGQTSVDFNVDDNGTDGQRWVAVTIRDAVQVYDWAHWGESAVVDRAPSVQGIDGGLLICTWGSIFDSGTFDDPPGDMTEQVNGNTGFADTRVMAATKALTATERTGEKIATHTSINQYVANVSVSIY